MRWRSEKHPAEGGVKGFTYNQGETDMHRSMGRRVKDRITGFEGVVTGYCEYITGCNQALVAPPAKDDGEFVESRWFDEQRLVQLGDEAVTLDNGSHPGPDKPAPVR